MSIMIIYGGTRENGNTEILAERAVEGLDVERIYLKDYKILPIEDLRHSEEGFLEKNDDDHNSIVKRIQAHEMIIFATPIYWYSMSGIMKNFIDRWSQTIKDPRYEFKHSMSSKKTFVIGVGGDEPFVKGLPMIQQFKYIFDFIGASFEGYILGKGNKPGEIYHDEAAFELASLMQKRL
ncbi:flavodoxin family protein [Salicibibacter cibi]|uniref:Flavodoxin family protein n=1 Tax=Salicibibacter cibi TaxID=2743001 RepID=A0A7T7CFL7_9BACI|nr:flavodoxin family protein [Salicibibacter cibi]QQK80208.1 flavodoxin family protein [Salicibibacter cibi]